MDATVTPAPGTTGAGNAAPRLSVVMPAYNEAANIEGAIDDVVSHVFAVVPDAELVVVDDGSRDDTRAIATACADRDRRIRVVSQPNAGHGPALVRGLRAARGDYCLLLDSDRQIGLTEFAETWRLAHACDAVLGVRRNRDDPRHRLLLTVALRAFLRRGLGVDAVDANVPYKLVRRAVVGAALDAMPLEPQVPSILLTVYLSRRRVPTVQQPVPHFARRGGVTTLRYLRLARFCRAATGEVLHFHRHLDRGPR